MSLLLTRDTVLLRQQLRLAADGSAVRDAYGNDVHDEVTVTIPNCNWEPRQTTENVESRQVVVSGLVWYCADPHVVVKPSDAFLIDSLRYEVDGEVGRFTGGKLGTDHATVALRRTTG